MEEAVVKRIMPHSNEAEQAYGFGGYPHCNGKTL